MAASGTNSITIETWKNQEKPAFQNFNEFVALRLEGGIFRALGKKMQNDLNAKSVTAVVLPWGTYSAEVRNVGEGTNITPAWEPAKAFIKMCNDNTLSARDLKTDNIDPEYLQLFKDYVAYGYFNPNDKENSNRPAKDKGLKMSEDEAEYFLSGYAQVLATIAREKARPNKIYRLEIYEEFPHGSFDFSYDEDGEVKSIKFIPSKTFKQFLKDDDQSIDASSEFSAPVGGNDYVTDDSADDVEDVGI